MAAQSAFPRGVSWQTSDGQEFWTQVVTSAGSAELQQRPNLGIDGLDHVLVVRQGDTRHELRPGESVVLDSGRLGYLGLDSWIGYRIVRDPSEPWLAASVVVAVLSLVWFYFRRLGHRLPDDGDDGALRA